jgi:general nucleoside transport system permease protein
MTGPESRGGPDPTAPSGAIAPAGEAAAAAPTPSPRQRVPQVIIEAILEGRPAVVTVLAIAVAMVVGGVLIAFSDPVVLHAWSLFFSAPGNAIAKTLDSAASAYTAMFEGAIFNPHTVTAIFQQASLSTALHDGYISAVFAPLSNTAVYATPLILTGLSVAVAFRSGLFNIGAAGQWIGGAIVATWLGFAVSLPLVVHAVVCVLGGFIGGAAIGWVAGVLKARTGAHEVIVTIMFNYVMYNLLSFLLGTPTALQLPHQANLQSPNIAQDARLPHIAGPTLRVNAGFLLALAAAAAIWWLLSRSTTGFEFRAVGANPSAARSAGMSVERTWILTMLIAGGLAGLAGSAVIQGTDYYLTFQSYGTYGFDGITVALLGRAKPLGVVLAALLFGALHAGGVQMGAANQTPVDVVTVIQALIVLFVAAPPMIRALFRLRAARAPGIEAVTKGWNA